LDASVILTHAYAFGYSHANSNSIRVIVMPPATPAKTVATVKPKSNSDPVLKNFQSQEQKALDKLERIKTWPKEHQNAATLATQRKLNQIREAMKKSGN
jgi:hypothetical protein